MDAGLPRSARVRQRAEFDRVFADGRRNADPLMSLHWLRSDVPARLGLAVSRKVDPRAVGRNRIKRVLRAEFRTLRKQLATGDYVLVARAAARGCDANALRIALASLLRRAGALPAAGPGGTMPAACVPGDTPQSP
jgi:ribonuclease P protein component